MKLEVEFLDDDEVVHNGKVIFTVFDMAMNDMIIGLPDLVRTFGHLFVKKLESVIRCEGEQQLDSEPLLNHLWATTEEFVKAEIP
jgi:hypothetical protein